MTSDDFTQPRIDPEVENAIQKAVERLKIFQRKGLLERRVTANAFSALIWAQCLVDGNFNLEAARTVLGRARAGDGIAIEMLRDIVSKLRKMRGPLPADLETFLLEASRASSSRPVSRSWILQRDYYLALAVAEVTRLPYDGKTFPPTSNLSRKFGRPTPSACWIVAQALRRMGHGKGVAAVTAAWRKTNILRKQLARNQRKVPIGLSGLLFFTAPKDYRELI